MTLTAPRVDSELTQCEPESEARPRPNANILLLSTHVCHVSTNLNAMIYTCRVIALSFFFGKFQNKSAVTSSIFLCKWNAL